MNQRKIIATLSMTAAALLAGCASPDYQTADAGDVLQVPRQNESLGEAMQRESQGDGCLVAGNLGRRSCEGMDAVLAPDSLVDRIELPPPPPPSQPPPPAQ